MPESTWPGIRPDAQRLVVYNEALRVYAFDKASPGVLKDSEADAQDGFADDEAKMDKQLRRLARGGLCVAHELQVSSA